MTKVEELRGQIVDMADGVSFSEITRFLGLLDSYAAVNHAEGVAEGAEQAKADIWKAQLYGYRVQLYPFPHDERAGLRVETDVNGVAYTLVPTVALAPTKESE